MVRRLSVRVEHWPIRGTFRIARGEKREAVVVVAEIAEGDARGRGECVPYARYGETPETVIRAIEGLAGLVSAGLDRDALRGTLPPGAARNAVDCALHDLEARLSGAPVHERLGLPPPARVPTCVTISIDEPAVVASAATRLASASLLKVKLAGDALDVARLEAVRVAAPNARIVADANESWTIETLVRDGPRLAELGIALLEQPLPQGADAALAHVAHAVPIAADESVHDLETLASVAERYDAVNVKLDKTGGLTEALDVVREATRLGLAVELGCMVSTSLSIAPALLLASLASVVDLDGAWLLERDRENGVRYADGYVSPAPVGFWGT